MKAHICNVKVTLKVDSKSKVDLQSSTYPLGVYAPPWGALVNI